MKKKNGKRRRKRRGGHKEILRRDFPHGPSDAKAQSQAASPLNIAPQDTKLQSGAEGTSHHSRKIQS